jgi:hypothetical protein
MNTIYTVKHIQKGLPFLYFSMRAFTFVSEMWYNIRVSEIK